jgi:hypothetical protein
VPRPKTTPSPRGAKENGPARYALSSLTPNGYRRYAGHQVRIAGVVGCVSRTIFICLP